MLSSNTLSACSDCLRITLAECLETLTIEAHLANATDYDVYVENIHGSCWKQTVTSDGSGVIDVDLRDEDNSGVFPVGLLNRHAGLFTLYIKKDSDESDAVITLTDGEYQCIKFDFGECNPEETTYTIS